VKTNWMMTNSDPYMLTPRRQIVTPTCWPCYSWSGDIQILHLFQCHMWWSFFLFSDRSCCWYWKNWGPTLFKLSFHNIHELELRNKLEIQRKGLHVLTCFLCKICIRKKSNLSMQHSSKLKTTCRILFHQQVLWLDKNKVTTYQAQASHQFLATNKEICLKTKKIYKSKMYF
jgi:hypothetical protein